MAIHPRLSTTMALPESTQFMPVYYPEPMAQYIPADDNSEDCSQAPQPCTIPLAVASNPREDNLSELFDNWMWSAGDLDSLTAHTDSQELLQRTDSITSASTNTKSLQQSSCSPDSTQASDRKRSRSQRRTEQNRAAQRAFRERKTRAMLGLQSDIREAQENAATLRDENEQLRKALGKAEREIEVLRAVLDRSSPPERSSLPSQHAPVGLVRGVAAQGTGGSTSTSARSFVLTVDFDFDRDSGDDLCKMGGGKGKPVVSISSLVAVSSDRGKVTGDVKTKRAQCKS